jgi:hypothetical protein
MFKKNEQFVIPPLLNEPDYIQDPMPVYKTYITYTTPVSSDTEYDTEYDENNYTIETSEEEIDEFN